MAFVFHWFPDTRRGRKMARRHIDNVQRRLFTELVLRYGYTEEGRWT